MLLNRLFLAVCLLAPAAAWAQPAAIDHAPFDALLKKHVHGDRVDYAALKGSAELDAYVAALAKVDPDALTDKRAQLALWINAYNALTLKAVLQHWPNIKSVQDPYPDFGFFKQKVHEIGGKKYALNDVENEVIRPRFNDPRIHAALNCASISCPPLAPHAFVADKLDAQLDAQMRQFARDRARNPLVQGEVAKLSQIFNWYEKDFTAAGGPKAYLARFLDATESAALQKATKVEFVEYDWRLNGK